METNTYLSYSTSNPHPNSPPQAGEGTSFRQPESCCHVLKRATLVFCAGAPNPELSILNQGFDLLVGVDGGAHILATHGYTPDWAIGDFDSAPPPECRHILRLPPEKDDTDLEAALLHILPNYPVEQIEKIVILGALGGGRLDHLLANIWLAQQPRFADYVEKFFFWEQGNTLKFYRAGCHRIRREWDKRYLSFIGLTALRGVSLRGVKYGVSEQDYPQPIALISNEFLGDEMALDLHDGLVAAIQSRDVI